MPLSSLSTETGLTIFNGTAYVNPGILYTACVAISPFSPDHSSKLMRSAGCSACVEKKRFSSRFRALCWTQLFVAELPTWDALSGLIMNFPNELLSPHSALVKLPEHLHPTSCATSALRILHCCQALLSMLDEPRHLSVPLYTTD